MFQKGLGTWECFVVVPPVWGLRWCNCWSLCVYLLVSLHCVRISPFYFPLPPVLSPLYFLLSPSLLFIVSALSPSVSFCLWSCPPCCWSLWPSGFRFLSIYLPSCSSLCPRCLPSCLPLSPVLSSFLLVIVSILFPFCFLSSPLGTVSVLSSFCFLLSPFFPLHLPPFSPSRLHLCRSAGLLCCNPQLYSYTYLPAVTAVSASALQSFTTCALASLCILSPNFAVVSLCLHLSPALDCCGRLCLAILCFLGLDVASSSCRVFRY